MLPRKKMVASKPALAHGKQAENRLLRLVILQTVAFLLAVWVRAIVGGVGVAHSAVAGLVFAAVLVALCLSGGLSWRFNRWLSLWVGLLGAAVLWVPVYIQSLHSPSIPPAGNYFSWAVVVAIVALAEEAFLRGTFFAGVAQLGGNKLAILAGALLFALLHIPLYGWHVVPLDFLVGIWLGVLRVWTNSWLAPGIAHTGADLIGWWFV